MADAHGGYTYLCPPLCRGMGHPECKGTPWIEAARPTPVIPPVPHEKWSALRKEIERLRALLKKHGIEA